jgi:hypothetical protein
MESYFIMMTLNKLDNCVFPTMLLSASKQVDLSCTKEFTKFFNTLVGLCSLVQKNLEEIKAGKLSDATDALAADCSCHLRALYVADLAKELFQGDSLLAKEFVSTIDKLEKLKEKIQEINQTMADWLRTNKVPGKDILPKEEILKKMGVWQGQIILRSSCKFELHQVIEKLKLSIEISPKIAYLVNAYVLTLVKQFIPINTKDHVFCADCSKLLSLENHVFKETTKKKALTQSISKIIGKAANNLSTNLLENDVYKLAKQSINKDSIDFLLLKIQKQGDSETHALLKNNIKVVEDKLELPDYYSLKAVFQTCLHDYIPLLLKVKKCTHSHQYEEFDQSFDVVLYLVPEEGKFQPKPLPTDLTSVAVIVEAKRAGQAIENEPTQEYANRLMKDFNFMEICEMDGAQHKQYTSDQDLDALPSQTILQITEEEGKRLDALKEKAQKKGCSIRNQTLMVLSHIFADTLKNQISNEQQKEICQSSFSYWNEKESEE